MKGLFRVKRLHGGPGGSFFIEDPGRYVEKALETGISLYRGPTLWNLEEGSSTWDFRM
jgi:hypothetical protein